MFKSEVYIRRREELHKIVKTGIALFIGNNEAPLNYPANTYHFRQDSDFLGRSFTREEFLGRKLCTEITLTTLQGQLREAEVCLASAKSDDGDIKTYAYIRDITERRRCEKDLENSGEKLRTLFERVRHGLFISSKEGRFIECNQALLDMLGYPNKKDLLRKDLPQDIYVNLEDRNMFMEKVEREGCVKDMEVEFKKKGRRKD